MPDIKQCELTSEHEPHAWSEDGRSRSWHHFCGGVRAPSTCPECAAGKHRACDGVAWDFEADAETACTCAEVSHG